MRKTAVALLLALLSTGAAQQAAPDPAADPLVMQRRLATVLRQSTQHYEAGEYQAALDRLGVLQGPAGQDLSVLNLRGAILTKLGQYDEARDLFLSILTTDPDYFPAAFNLGEVDFLRGDYDAATETFQRIGRSQPRNELVRFKIFLCELLLGRDDEAGRIARGLIPAGNTPAWYYAQAMLARKGGDEKSAARHISAAQAIYLESGCKLFDESVEAVNFSDRASSP
jgi:Flp pilus assembly protein TadD